MERLIRNWQRSVPVRALTAANSVRASGQLRQREAYGAMWKR